MTCFHSQFAQLPSTFHSFLLDTDGKMVVIGDASTNHYARDEVFDVISREMTGKCLIRMKSNGLIGSNPQMMAPIIPKRDVMVSNKMSGVCKRRCHVLHVSYKNSENQVKMFGVAM